MSKKRRSRDQRGPEKSQPKSEPQLERREETRAREIFSRVTPFRVAFFLLFLGALLSPLLSKNSRVGDIKFGNRIFRFVPQWDSQEDFDLSRAVPQLEKYCRDLSGIIDIPDSFLVKILPSESGGDVALDILYDLEKFKSERELVITQLESIGELSINPRLINDSTFAHELFHFVRVHTGTFVCHDGFEEGLAEYAENRIYPSATILEIRCFFDAFPELGMIPVDDTVFALDKLLGRTDATSSAFFKHESRARAWRRFLEDPEYPQRRDFIRRFQRAQLAEPQLWTLQKALDLGEELEPGFREWFEGEEVFQAPEREQKIVRAVLLHDKIVLLRFWQRRMDKEDERDPELYEIVPFHCPIDIVLTTKTGLRFTGVVPSANSRLVPSAVPLIQFGIRRADDIESVSLRVQGSEEEIPFKRYSR